MKKKTAFRMFFLFVLFNFLIPQNCGLFAQVSISQSSVSQLPYRQKFVDGKSFVQNSGAQISNKQTSTDANSVAQNSLAKSSNESNFPESNSVAEVQPLRISSLQAPAGKTSTVHPPISLDPPSKEGENSSDAISTNSLRLSLEDCISIALERNHRRPASKLAVEIAEAQHKQTLSAWWPQFLLRSSYTKLDQPMNFIFPQETSVYQISGLAPVPVPTTVTVPEKNVKLMDDRTTLTSLSMTYPLYTGGAREGMKHQASSGIDAAREESRKTDLEIIRDTRKYYAGAILSRNLRIIAEEVLDQLETTLRLTESLYKAGSGKVKKTDFLKNKIYVESTKSSLSQLRGNEATALCALINTLGLNWNSKVSLAEEIIPVSKISADPEMLISASWQFNPDWKKINAGLSALNGAMKIAKSGLLPKIAITGNLNYLNNSYDKGIVTPDNKNSWSLGLGLEMPLFDGNLTPAKINEARARIKKLQHEKILLKEGIALLVQQCLNSTISSQNQLESLEKAVEASVENRDLNIRAYQNELVETKDVLEAQITAAFMKAALEMARFTQFASKSELETVVGQEVNKILTEPNF
ncbi:MAG: TolC family protein [Candidatus Riflebacteria bacterium]|nr:TolC family protein [Candidatus Riflebacteria bacterium]